MSFDFETVEAPLPILIGNEEETGMLVDINGVIDEPYDLSNELPRHIPEALMGNHNEYLTNGFRVYVGGYENMDKPTNIERSTPECTLPSEVTTYIRIGEVLMDRIVENYIKEATIVSDDKINVRMQRRVVDSADNRKGCHDNFGIQIPDYSEEPSAIYPYILEYISTRQFITGAGHIGKDHGPHYSQKINGLSRLTGHGYYGSVASINSDTDNYRLEIRCNDINISDWATKVRIGGMALVIALNEVDQLSALKNYTANLSDGQYIKRIQTLNEIYLFDNGNLEATKMQMRALDFQQRVAELALKKLGLYVDVPYDYYSLAKEIYDYCDDYRSVIKGSEDFSILADRADWAAKLLAIRSGIERDRDFGIKRDYQDIIAQAMDMKYDFRSIRGEAGKIVEKKIGYGYKLRDRGLFRNTIPNEQISKRFTVPPEDTRAKLRTQLLLDKSIIVDDWSTIEYYEDDDAEYAKSLKIKAREIELSDYNYEKLKNRIIDENK